MDSNKKRILIIDDDEIYIFGITKLIQIKSLATDVMVKENGLFALHYIKELIESNSPLPELILLDLNMPILDGWKFLEKYSSIEQHFREKMRVFVMSSSIAKSDYERSNLITDVKGYYVKPISIPDLTKLLQS